MSERARNIVPIVSFQNRYSFADREAKIQAAIKRLCDRSKFRTFGRIFSIFVSNEKQTGCGGRRRLARNLSAAGKL
jgi:hypothetical protein